MVKKMVRIENEYFGHSDCLDPSTYSEVIDHIKFMYKAFAKTGLPNRCGNLSDEETKGNLSKAYHIPIEIINDILVYIEFLDDECDEKLYLAKLSQQEYNNVMKPVGRVALELRKDGLTDEKIRPWITKLVTGMLDERERRGKIILKPWFLEWDVLIGYRKKVPKASAKPFRAPKKKTFSHQPGVTRAFYGPKTVEEIQEKFYQTIRDLTNLSEINPNSFKAFKKGLIQAIGYLGRISVAITDLEKNYNLEVEDGNTD